MKNKTSILATFVALAALVFASAPAKAQSPTPTTAPVVNSENAARVFLGSEINHFVGSFGSWLKSTGPGQPDTWEYGDFRMSPDGSITELSLNGSPVSIDPSQPLAGLPYPTTGIRTQFYFHLNAFDRYGKFVASGNFGTTVLKKGDPIIVKLEAATVPNFVRFTMPTGVNPNNLILEDTDGSSWNYDIRAGGFNVYSDPISGMGYRIIDQSTGIIYGVGHVPPFEAPVSATNESLVNIQYEGNVVELPFSPTRRYIYRQAQKLDGSVVNTEGNTVPAKVYMARLRGNSLSVYVNAVRGKVVVKQWVAEGELPTIAEGVTVNYPDDTSSGGVSIPAGYDRVIIEITGELEDPDGFSTSISSYPEGDGAKG